MTFSLPVAAVVAKTPLYLGIETVFCRLFQQMTRVDMG